MTAPIIFSLPDLPIKACLDDLREALRGGHATLGASPGSGKTTVAPLALLDEPWLGDKKIIMLEPRRPAARMAAHRMAFLLGEKVGETVGYQVRFDRKISSQTRIEVLTEGLLLRRLQSDPELSGVGLVIFDEFHERSLAADLSLTLCQDICDSLRDDLRLLVMSASLDDEGVNQLLGGQNISAGGQLHPVTIHYAPLESSLAEVVDSCTPLIAEALNRTKGDILVFLPGRGEISRLHAIAEDRWGMVCDVLDLHGELGVEQQDIVLRPAAHKRRRLILSTDIAETSLTIEGVEAVVDGGRARKPVFQPNSGLTRLETRWVSKASALQRAGRAGRLGPGHCFRAWTESRQNRLEEWIRPEIADADLAPLVLELAAWGVNDPTTMVWVTPPPEGHWKQARELLHELEAVDATGRITGRGKAMSSLPLHPRLAHMLLAAKSLDERQLASDIAALLSDRDPMQTRRGEPGAIDITLRLSALDEWRKGRSISGFSQRQLRQLDKLSRQYIKLLPKGGKQNRSDLSAGSCLATAYPDRIAKRRGRGSNYLMRNGRGVQLSDSDSLVISEYLVIPHLDAGKRDGKAWLAASIDISEITLLFSEQITEGREVSWDSERSKVTGRQRRSLGKLLLEERQVPLTVGDPVESVLLEQIRREGMILFGEQKKLDTLCARVETLAGVEAVEEWPDCSEQGLLDSLEEWLLPWLAKVESLKQLKRIDLSAALLAWLGWSRQESLNRQLPEFFVTPGGSRRAIIYDRSEAPILRVPLQEMLGASETPAVAGGELPLVVHLLSPAGRPLQITRDLVGFWRGSYEEVKKEMKGRYPKHAWPDDPLSALPTRRRRR